MKLIAINGSPRQKGNTRTALDTVGKILADNGIDMEVIDIGSENCRGCMACGKCRQNNNRCIYDDAVNQVLNKMHDADGIIIGSPTYYAGMNGTLKCFLDRLFMAGASEFRHKVGAAVVAVRRAGALPVFEQINKYFSISEMVTVGGNYWNMVFGGLPGECVKDDEGIQNMRVLARNIAWLVKTIALSRVDKPHPEVKIKTNLVR